MLHMTLVSPYIRLQTQLLTTTTALSHLYVIHIFCNLLAAEALAKVKDQNISQAFRELFLPDGQVPLSGLFTRRLDLAAILYRIAIDGISEFYNGNLTQEIVTEVSSFCKYQHVH